MRLSTRTVVDQVLNNLDGNYQRLVQLQRQLSTGRRVTRLSDDPARASEGLRYRSELSRGTQFVRNIDATAARLEATESSMGTMNDLLQRAREVAVYGANDTVSAAQRVTLAAEVEQLMEQAIQVGNTNFSGQYIYGGTATTTVPFAISSGPPMAATYNGNAGLIERQIGSATRVDVNVPGDAAFAPSFQALSDLHAALTAGTGVSATIAGIDTALDGILQLRGQFGAKVSRLELTRIEQTNAQFTAEVAIANAEEIDFPEVVTRLQSQEAAYQAALSATARVVQPSLLDFLR